MIRSRKSRQRWRVSTKAGLSKKNLRTVSFTYFNQPSKSILFKHSTNSRYHLCCSRRPLLAPTVTNLSWLCFCHTARDGWGASFLCQVRAQQTSQTDAQKARNGPNLTPLSPRSRGHSAVRVGMERGNCGDLYKKAAL